MFIDKKRLKLYSDSLVFSISKKDKIKFRSIAYKNRMTMSELCRRFVKIIILLESTYNYENKKEVNNAELEKILTILGRSN